MFSIERLQISRFMSIEDSELLLPPYGLISIRGIVEGKSNSSNGAGKSALVESIFWALYGKTLRGASTDKSWEVTLEGRLLSSSNEKGQPFVIRRTKSDIDLNIEGEELQAYLKTDKQRILNRLILKHTSWNTFALLSYLTPYTITNWFMKMTDSDRKGILLEVLELQWLDEVYEQVRRDIADATSQLNQYQQEVKRLEGYIAGVRSSQPNSVAPFVERVITLTEELKAFDINLGKVDKERLSKEVSYVDALFEKVSRIQEDLNLIMSGINQEMSALSEQRSQLNAQLSNLLSQKVFLETNSVCPTCKRPLEDSYKENMLEDINRQVEELRSKLVKVEEEHRNIFGYHQSVSEIIDKVNSLSYDLAVIKKQLSSPRQSIEPFLRKKQDYERQVQLLQCKLEELSKWKEIFSATGVKSMVVNSIFQRIAERTAVYAQYLGIDFKQSMKKGRIKYDNYKNLSSGERRRGEIALLFALRDIIPTPSPLLVIDEVFDHLDQEGIQSVLPILEMVSQNQQVFIISHRPDLLLPKVDLDIVVVKTQGKSKVTILN